jgi:D-3-phosphoglycerate dehydrogenase/(S)-sulfolactate dehydrogenase
VLLRAEIFDREKIAGSPRLKIIARHGIGFDNVDLDAATEAGVWVTVTPGRNSRAVAEHVFALALSLAWQVPTAAGRTSGGQWSEGNAGLTGVELHGRTLGLLGLGSIGSLVLEIARGFGMQVRVTDPFLDGDQIAALGARKVEFDELLVGSDVLSLHVPLSAATRHIIDKAALARLRPGAVLINTSRGGLVDEAALAAALRSGQLPRKKPCAAASSPPPRTSLNVGGPARPNPDAAAPGGGRCSRPDGSETAALVLTDKSGFGLTGTDDDL